jgi:hypothetical protein
VVFNETEIAVIIAADDFAATKTERTPKGTEERNNSGTVCMGSAMGVEMRINGGAVGMNGGIAVGPVAPPERSGTIKHRGGCNV